MAPHRLSAASLDAWLHVLDQVQESIGQAIQDVAYHERALDASEPPAHLGAAEENSWAQFDERLRHLESHLAAADDAAGQVEELVCEDERAAQAWLREAAAARQRLAAAGAVGLS